MDLRATWRQAFIAFLFPVALILASRWLFIEPYVIPSGSMLPTLQVHDHIFVNKLAYGIRLPFSKSWLIRWSEPSHGEVVVFFNPENPEVFYVKRVIAKEGDVVKIGGRKISINDQEIETVEVPSGALLRSAHFPIDEGYDWALENNHWVRFQQSDVASEETSEFHVPKGSLFVMGDNRDESSDSRSWGFVPVGHVLGRASLIWLACSSTLPSAGFLCDPQQLLWTRILTFVHEPVSIEE